MAAKKQKNSKDNLTKLERLKQRQAQIAAQIRNEQNKERSKERKLDTRRKIIMGALVLSHMENDAEFKATCERLQHEGIKSEADRALFNLASL